jgi:hypothetical protein
MTASTRAAGSGAALIAASAAFAAFWLADIPFDAPDSVWALTLGLHGLTFVLITVGLVLMAGGLELAGWRRIVWWLGAALTAAGSVTGWLPFAGGLLVIGGFEIAARRPLAGAALITGAAALAAVYFRGVHYGDEHSRAASSAEEAAAIAGVILVAIGLSAIGAGQLRRGRRMAGQSEQP